MLSEIHTLPVGWRPDHAIRNNGPTSFVIERLKLREMAEGFPCYRDSCEWENLISIFRPGAYIYTTWTGRTPFMDFIAASKKAMDNGAFVVHRVHGSSTDISCSSKRAVTKMKATISQRFNLEGILVDVEVDCRFCFFWSRDTDSGDWGAEYVRHWYEKDKLIPVNPTKIPILDEARLKTYPSGYCYLAYCQEETMGVQVKLDMPGHRREGSNINGQKHDELYRQVKAWVEDQEIDI